jgi:hypothetical protein
MFVRDAPRCWRYKMSNLVNKKNDIWEWHNSILDPKDLLLSIKNEDWNYYSNDFGKGGGTIIGRSHFVKPGTDIHKKIMEVFLKGINEYVINNNLSFLDENVGQDSLMIREYQVGSSMLEHSDIYSYLTKDGQNVSPSLTAILYLNEDYEGGQINFVHDDLCITPKAGSLVVFPSNKQHEVLTITKGNRYMVQTYVYDKPRSFYDKD